ncbi:DUF3813 family protein [Pontibacillus yanchengensis]|uniref:DUF3813 family protein n=2 Tax=Pontibacillus yanchengensis TaxID=462910 RepID=A0ACC7VDR4_9BACI|nr:DUF3813 family protein [Pontibacillus yanchengensis]MYL32257.1 DUF3813 family protein [Pontibacillus yanchengensis]MYL52837.1 DUF3813 family protein [Pontibacillus yanchengensis]
MQNRNNLFQQAREAVSNVTNRKGAASQEEVSIAKNCINSARANASEEEQGQLQQLQQEIERHEGLK